MLAFGSGAVGGMKRRSDAAIAGLRARLQTLFQNAINNIAGTQSLGTYQEDNQGSLPAFEAANSRQPDLRQSRRQRVELVVVRQLFLVAGGRRRSDRRLHRSIQDVSSDPADHRAAFAQALTYFANRGASPDQIFSQLLAGMMSLADGNLATILVGVQAVKDALLQLLQESHPDFPGAAEFRVGYTVRDGLLQPDHGRLAIERGRPDLLDAAIPITVLYKVVFGAAPFPDDASFTAFDASFNGAAMLTASGLGPSKALDHWAPIRSRLDGAAAEDRRSAAGHRIGIAPVPIKPREDALQRIAHNRRTERSIQVVNPRLRDDPALVGVLDLGQWRRVAPNPKILQRGAGDRRSVFRTRRVVG